MSKSGDFSPKKKGTVKRVEQLLKEIMKLMDYI
jgi:hypothetical protein